jgi:hypothetical protein
MPKLIEDITPEMNKLENSDAGRSDLVPEDYWAIPGAIIGLSIIIGTWLLWRLLR